MDRAPLFDSIRRSLFASGLKQGAVDGVEAILRACERHSITDGRHVVNILAQVYHETGGQMLPVKETVFASSIDRNPSDATVIARLDKAFAAGQLTWVQTPYWRDGWFGRGSIQITHRDNYAKLGIALGVDLVGKRDLALDLDLSASIAVVGMSRGLFTGRKLADFFGAASDPAGARAIVNGDTKTIGPKIAAYHFAFMTALDAGGGWSIAPAKPAAPMATLSADELAAVRLAMDWMAGCPVDAKTLRAVADWLAARPGEAA